MRIWHVLRARSSEHQPPGPAEVSRFACSVRMHYNPMEFLTGLAVRYGGIVRIPLSQGPLYIDLPIYPSPQGIAIASVRRSR